MACGFRLDEAWQLASELERRIGERIECSYDATYGYLTCCPTNVGTGLRASVMLHLPALALLPTEIEKVFTAAQRTGLAVRGLYGEGSRAVGDFYQLSNQVTLGRSEETLLAELRELVPAVIKFERTVRAELLKEQRDKVLDRVRRSRGMLRTARAMPTDNALAHLSNLRLGCLLGVFDGAEVDDLARMRVQIQKGHLQVLSQRRLADELVDATERDRLRAEFLRGRFRS
jgi:protein arginine kinase